MHGPPAETASDTPTVTLLTEGTYPHSHGGVSVWCDQLVQGMPDVDFRVIAVTGTGREPLAWELPGHVRKVESHALWGPPPPGRAPRGRDLRAFLTAYEQFLLSLLDPDQEPHFARTFYRLADHAASGTLSAALRGEAAARTLVRVWNRPHLHTAAARPTLHDALLATDLLEHALRPLAATPPARGVTHAVSGGLATLPGLVAHHRHGTPFLLTEHGIYLRERYLSFRAESYRWPVKALMLGLFRLLAVESYRCASLVTPGNRYNRRWEEHGGTPPDRIRTVYNGVDPTAFPPAGPEPDAPTLSWAGRVDPIKGLETLIRAFALVREEIPEARLRLFGGTPRGGEGYRTACEKLAAELGAGEAVVFEGRVDDIRDAYAAGNVVMLSSISEGFPFTLIEAMSCGRATVSTDVGGVREAVGDTGFVVPPRDPEAMARAALKLLRDPAQRADMGERARLRVIEQFTLRQTIDAFRDIYHDLAGTRRPESALERPRRRQEAPARALADAERPVMAMAAGGAG
ncbi:GT4 family glycosyltransferase PelF [Streptomyces roseifaciens]|uniref:GT4 family glycosyltransferase PelF n=1 Tax=Streptomyces roseifaciens TaxID=1488406 RepID=UPI00099FB1D1|nr:GT4 family glycosyltransferase PelF [Streptomyces roseifaciens]